VIRGRGAAILAIAAALFAATAAASGATAKGPSRKAVKGCRWEKLADPKVGLEAWVQQCDFGFRKIDFLFEGTSLAVRYSDGGGKPDPLVDVLDLAPGETPEQGIRRLFDERTDKAVASRCVLAPYGGAGKRAPRGVLRFTFVPNAAFATELAAEADPDEIPDPPCGDWGDAPDGIQYFEAHPGPARKVLFVRVGQDEPLFDEMTLKLIGF
jgi:hypothetical protein